MRTTIIIILILLLGYTAGAQSFFPIKGQFKDTTLCTPCMPGFRLVTQDQDGNRHTFLLLAQKDTYERKRRVSSDGKFPVEIIFDPVNVFMVFQDSLFISGGKDGYEFKIFTKK